MSDSLLAHVVGQFAPRQWENIATEALAFLLRHPGVDDALGPLLSPLGFEVGQQLEWRTQAVDAGDEGRPDLVGNDPSGRHVVIVEAKFWAALTDNQPVTYLERQSAQFAGGGDRPLLVFLVPQARVDLIVAELRTRLPGAALTRLGLPVLDHQLGRTVILSWQQLLAAIEVTLRQHGDARLLEDLGQLRGLTDRADQEAMLPLQPGDVDPERGRRYLQFCDVIDAVTDRLVGEKLVSTKGLRATGGKGSYVRYVKAGPHEFGLFVHSGWWSRDYPSPWWLRFWNVKPAVATAIQELGRADVLPYVELSGGHLYAALTPPLRIDGAAVVENLAAALRGVIAALPSAAPTRLQAPAGSDPDHVVAEEAQE